MNLKISICLAGAIGCHAAMLFGYRTHTVQARERPEPERPYLEVSLAPSAPPVEAAPVPPPVAKVEEPPPPPETKPEPLPEPPPPIPKDEAVVKAPEPEPTPAPITPPAPAPATQQVAAVTAPAVAVPNAPSGEAVVAVTPAPLHGKYLEVSQPSYLKRLDPEYPARARRARQQGTVVLALYINELGSIDKVEVVQSSGHAALDEAALAAEKKSRFRPAYRGNQPVPSRAEVPYHFKLN